jgi:metallo-beta-lactamase class B
MVRPEIFMRRACEYIVAFLLMIAMSVTSPRAEEPQPVRPTEEQLANDNKLFIALAIKVFKWEEPAEPVKIAGPIYFVGTKGLGAFIFATSDGLILMNTGMPSSGAMIEDSIRKLGFKPEDLKIMINGHAHIDHAGAFAYLKEKYGAKRF